MTYQLLGKLYYKNHSEYLQTYHRRFDSEQTVRLNFAVGENQTFFVENAEVYELAYKIEKMDKAVSRLSRNLPGVARKQYSRKCLIDEIVLTNKIEGVHSSRKEIDDALEQLKKQTEKKGKHKRYLSLVNKYLKLITGEKIRIETCQDIRDIYDEVFLEEILAEEPQNAPDGKLFRKELAEIYSPTERVVHQGCYPETEIISAIEKALAFLNDESVTYLFRICVFHYLLEYIHPFYDGNGRLGRFILSYGLTKELEPLIAYRISETIKENISEYYKAFQVCNDPRNLGDLTPFLLMMLKMIYRTLEDLYGSLHRKMIRLDRYEEQIDALLGGEGGKIRDVYSCLVQAGLFSENGISTEELVTHINVSYGTIKKLLDRVDPELMIVKKKRNAKYYQIDVNELDCRRLKKEGKGETESENAN